MIKPINIEISPSGTCNAKCPWCFYRNQHKKEFIRYDKMVSLFLYFNKIGLKAITWTGGGEPTLHPKFDQLVSLAATYKFKQGLITNGLAKINYDPTKFEWIRVSVEVRKTCQICCKNHEINKLVNTAINIKDSDFV